MAKSNARNRAGKSREYGLSRIAYTRAPEWNEKVGQEVYDRLGRVATFRQTTQKENCPFCNHTLHLPALGASENFMIVPGKAPLVPGHTLIIPLEHRESALELEEPHFRELGGIIGKIDAAMKRIKRPVSFSFNRGRIAGQSVAHMHIHVFPRSKTSLPGYMPTRAKFFDPLAAQVSEKVRLHLEAEKSPLLRFVSFPVKRSSEIKMILPSLDHLHTAGQALKQLYTVYDEEYAKLLVDPEGETVALPAYGKQAESARQAQVKLLKGQLPGRLRRIRAETAGKRIALGEEALRELVRSQQVGTMVDIAVVNKGKVEITLYPRATVIKPASAEQAVKGLRDVQPFGCGSMGRQGYQPVRESAQTPEKFKLTLKQQAKWARLN
ncbi:MAG: HIT family protein, partial [Candidatus Micrarchaeota archaeon]